MHKLALLFVALLGLTQVTAALTETSDVINLADFIQI
jgi:hypothetical protein